MWTLSQTSRQNSQTLGQPGVLQVLLSRRPRPHLLDPAVRRETAGQDRADRGSVLLLGRASPGIADKTPRCRRAGNEWGPVQLRVC
jgi:hypothetical protein